MSQDIVAVRRQVKQVHSLLRQDKLAMAVQAVIAALRLMLSTPLMKGERDEFADMVREGVDHINNDKAIRQIYPLALAYSPGDEKIVFEELKELADILKEATMSEVGDLSAALAAKKQAALDEGQEHLDNNNVEGARSVFKAISGEFPDDDALKGDIGEKFLDAGFYEDAAGYYSEAVQLNPDALHNYNKLAIALRKMGRFDVAEDYYMRALPLAPEDPNLLFNIGRLYIEWEKWDKAVEFGEKAHAISPEFDQARKLVNFARKRMA